MSESPTILPQLNLEHLQRMIFIYNAVTNGWTVKQKRNNVFEFTKERKVEERDLSRFSVLEEYLKHFLELNSKMDLFVNNT